MQKLRWAILATGSIAKSFANGLKHSQTGELVAVGSRELSRAEDFCSQFGGRPYGDYRSAVYADGVDAVYIATPHHCHEEDTILCAEARKHILCEKPFTLDEASAQRALAAVKKADVFFAEAFMYRFHPQSRQLRDLVHTNHVIGPIHHISVEFGFNAPRQWENFRAKKQFGGGALMDVGCYCTSFARLITGEEPERADYVIQKAEDGYDAIGAGILQFPGGCTTSFATAVHLTLNNQATIYGEKGHIQVTSPWFCHGEIQIYRTGAERPEIIRPSPVDNLYGNEADVVYYSLNQRQAEMCNWDDTLGNMRTIDALKASAGLQFGGGL
ncbi:MAG: Gfo/Idh/MocA family oxidoreductase [Fimbriimonadaceae bacterium]|jgi:predicted dehydrogenase|nr:Gfo/Idh/MocA family oxidoreductase [Fimbriimonadaceae bacterium]